MVNQLNNNSKKVLYLTYDGLTDPVGQSQILPYIVGLEEKGYIFFIISFEKRNNFTKNRKNTFLKIQNKNIKWFRLKYHKNPPVLSTILDLALMLILSIFLAIRYKIKIIHTRSYVPSLIGLKLKEMLKVKFIFDMRGFWADERVDGKIWNMNNPLYKLIYFYFKYKEKKMLKKADVIITLTQVAKNYIIENYSQIKPDRINVIPCATDFNFFDPDKITEKQKEEFKKKYNIPTSKFILGYCGSTNQWYEFDKMFRFFQLLDEEIDSFLVLSVYGDISTIKNYLKKFNLNSNKVFYGTFTYEEMPMVISIINLAILFIKPGYSKNSPSPTKFSEFTAMNIPVVCNSIGDLEKHSQLIPNIYCVNDFSDESFKNIISKLKQNYFYREDKNDKTIRNMSRRIYDLNLAIEKYLHIYSNL
ncbi:MAG: glycosyltransferase [Bacteroidales bacterium]|nr:glycosyltransferase [Bacteroidales bacterium]